jgi:DNA photolyase
MPTSTPNENEFALGNHALEYAVELANKLGRPLVVGFGLMDDYPEANLRHYVFMLEGLRETALALAKRGIGFVLRNGSPGASCARVGAARMPGSLRSRVSAAAARVPGAAFRQAELSGMPFG